MSKKIKSLKWQSVALEGVPPSMFDNLQGFVGLEECTDYGMDKNNKRKKKNAAEPKKRKLEKNRTLNQNSEVPQKKNKLSNGFVVESCSNITPSTTNQLDKLSNKKQENNENKNKNDKKKSNAITDPDIKLIVIDKKVKKPKLGENVSDLKSNLTPEDMLSWAEFKLPEELIKALMELGFKNPTKIQQLSLPAAIHGRRDILGAAETGSGKTLAFGLPILSGIMKLKEKASLKGLDVYDIPYKKSSVKKKEVNEVKDKKEKKNKKQKKRKEVCKVESCEDGYSSGEENGSKRNKNDDNGFVDEYEVPMRKRDESADAGNDSDDDNNYLHLSDMLDSDDMETGDDEEELDSENNENGSDDELDQNDSDYELQHNDSNDELEPKEFVHEHEQNEFDHEHEQNEFDDEVDEGNETDGVDEVDESNEGVGCVKVIDNIEIPGQVMVKTGKPLYALILTPTRELAIQISRHLIAAAKYTGIKIATIVGGMAAVKQERVLKSGPEIVVATPGRLWELLSQGQPHLQQLPSVKFLAIDETDRMIERGHFEELQPLLERLNSDETHKNARQNFVFSATLTLVHDLPGHMRGKKVTKRGKILNRKIEKMTPQQKVKRLVTMIGMTDPKVVDITTQNLGTAETLTECRITCSLDQKDGYLYYILKRHPGRTIVFCNSISSVRRLAQLLTLLKCNPLPLHASMPQRQRLKNLERFRDDPHGVLVATDVAARGLDIPDVDHVIHYQVPKTAENYVHRSGRTARANKEGLTILMMEPAEAYSYAKLCRTLNKTSELATFPVCASSLSPIKEIIKIARDLDSLLLKKKRATQAQGWRDKVAKDMDMIIDDDDVPTAKFDPTIDKAAKTKKRQLELMMSRPLFPKGFSFKYPTLNQPDALVQTTEDALQVMKKALETGQLKKEKRKSKNEPLLKLQKIFKQERKSK